MTSKKILEKCKLIKLVITDVDGVLTDGGMYYSEKGEILKKFNAKDGMGVEILLRHRVKTILLTRENSNIVKKRGAKIKTAATYIGILDKKSQLKKISKKFKVPPTKIAYIGDDLNDLEIMKFNTAISRLMEFTNHLNTLEFIPLNIKEKLVQLIAPITPHLSEELWEYLGHSDSIFEESWPKYNEKMIVDFENFTTQELMYLSKRIIIPHSSYSMTEALALDKEVFSFDFSGSAAYYFDSYGKDLVINSEDDLYKYLSLENNLEELEKL